MNFHLRHLFEIEYLGKKYDFFQRATGFEVEGKCPDCDFTQVGNEVEIVVVEQESSDEYWLGTTIEDCSPSTILSIFIREFLGCILQLTRFEISLGGNSYKLHTFPSIPTPKGSDSSKFNSPTLNQESVVPDGHLEN